MKTQLRSAWAAMAVGLIASNLAWAQDATLPSTVASPAAPTELVQPEQVATPGNDLYLNQWVRLTDDSSVVGSVVALSASEPVRVQKARVSLVQNGTVVAYDDTDIEGGFAIEKVAPGHYSLLVQSPNHLAIMSLTVLDPVAGRHLPEGVEVTVLSPVVPRIVEVLRGQTLPKSSVSFSDVSRDPLATARTFAHSTQIAIDKRNGISGQLFKVAGQADLSDTTVFLFKDGREVLRTRATADGKFRLVDVTPGTYGMIAAGKNGVAALSFSAAPEKMAAIGSNKERFVAFQGGPASSLNVELAEPTSFQPTNEPVIADAPIIEEGPMLGGGYPVGGGYGGGGGGFGGGGGGGIGGGGGLAALAGIGGLIAVGIAAADNNNNNPVSPVVTP